MHASIVMATRLILHRQTEVLLLVAALEEQPGLLLGTEAPFRVHNGIESSFLCYHIKDAVHTRGEGKMAAHQKRRLQQLHLFQERVLYKYGLTQGANIDTTRSALLPSSTSSTVFAYRSEQPAATMAIFTVRHTSSVCLSLWAASVVSVSLYCIKQLAN